VLLANVDIGGLDSSTLDHDQLGAVDPIVAARLSATFPYVTPAARRRAARGEAAVHLIDGGYFDNSGVATALDWIDDCFGSPREPGTRASQVERVLLLMIDPFPRGEPTLEPTGGWAAATLGPLLGVLAVRTGSQRAHMTQSIRQQRALLAARGGPELVPLTVRAGVDLPLSWKLTPGQQGLLDGAWDDRRIELREVLRQSARFGSDSTRDSGGGRPPTIPGLDQPFTPLALDVGFVEWLEDWSEAQSEWR
jgi:hypothetical protein